MKTGNEYLKLLNKKEKQDFINEFNWGGNKKIDDYLNDFFYNFDDFINEAFDFGSDYGYWESIINWYTTLLAQEEAKRLLSIYNKEQCFLYIESIIRSLTHHSSISFWKEVKRQLNKQ